MQRNRIGLLIALVAGVAIAVGLVLVIEQGADKSSGDTSDSEGDIGRVLNTVSFGYPDVENLLGQLDREQRMNVLAKPQLFKRMIDQETARLALLDAAMDTGLHERKNVAYMMRRKSEEFLVETFTRGKLNAAGLPAGFPSDAQIQDYYNKNKARFVIDERLPVWQIFWHIPKDASELEAAKMLKQASKISSTLRAGKTEFQTVAVEESEHEASRIQGGYMGLLKVSELRSDIRQPLLDLAVGKISKPIRSNNGVHVFLRGKVVSRVTKPLSQVREQIAVHLKNVFRQQQRSKLIQLAQEKYPVKLDPPDIEEWRVRLVKQNPANMGQQKP